MTGRVEGDRGLAGIEVLPLGLLVFVTGSLLVANAWAVVDARLAVGAASREAVRAYVEAPDQPTARERADAAARLALAGHGRSSDRSTVTVTHEGDRAWNRCVRVTITVHHQVPALTLPWIGGYGSGFDVSSRHSERIDPYRAGLPAGGRC